MEINATGLGAREYLPNKAYAEQELAQKAQEKKDNVQKTPKALEPKPAEQVSSDKQGRIDIYA